jgi:8-oxo-dGTP pyrophosphatase MutT (NUDIX family)
MDFIQCFNSEGEPAGFVPRQNFGLPEFLKAGLYYGVVNVAVICRPTGELLCSTRSKAPGRVDAGKNQSYFGGGPKPGEDHVGAAIRELFEEAGLAVGKNRLKLIDEGMAPASKRNYKTYAVFINNKVVIPANLSPEIIDYFWLFFDRYLGDSSNNPGQWCGRLKDWHLKEIERIMQSRF